MERVSEPEIHLRELQGIIGTIDLKYVVSEMKDGKAAAYYDVIESFTMKLGAQRIYMMNYDRRADQIFTGGEQRLFWRPDSAGGFGCGGSAVDAG